MYICIYIYIYYNKHPVFAAQVMGCRTSSAARASDVADHFKQNIGSCLFEQTTTIYIYLYLHLVLSLSLYIYIYMCIYIYIYSERGEIHCCFWFTSIQVPFGMGMALSGPGLGPFSARSGAALRRDTANLRPNHNDNNNNDNHNYYYDCGIQRI